ncbi:hypothetical protein B0H13DRAFT_2681180 [Mycena leptocephala]|nr:hypothetical protein B0H13DRAFT_2681180 [Mycena leptocephala]
MSLRLDFSPFRTHYFFLVTTVLAALGWLLALIFQAIATVQLGHRAIGSLWFAIILQAALNMGVILAVLTDSIGTARLQLAAFATMATVFAVRGTDLGVFAPQSCLQATGAGYLVLTLVDILWVLYFAASEDSFALRILGPPSTPTEPWSLRASAGGAAGSHMPTMKPNYKLGSGVGSPDMGVHEPKRSSIVRSVVGSVKRAPNAVNLRRSTPGRSSASRKSSSAASEEGEARPPGLFDADVPPVPSLTRSTWGGPEMPVAPDMARASSAGALLAGSVQSPLSIPALEEPAAQNDTESDLSMEEVVALPRARALHAYSGSPGDPNELSFGQGEVLEIEDQEGKWWQARKADGTLGIIPSNYFVMM